MNTKERIRNARNLMTENNLDAILVTKEENLYYFSGFRGDSTALILTNHDLLLITDRRYTEQAARQASDFIVIEQHDGLLRKAADVLQEHDVKAIGFEGNALSYSQYKQMERFLAGRSFEISLTLDTLRQIKDAAEISYVRQACRIADQAFAHIITYIRPGMTEMEIAAELENFMRRHGSERPAFQTIVASGVRGSLPHGTASEKCIADGELVTMDFGAVYRGYHSDITRTICVGRADGRQRELYDAVLSAQRKALLAIRAGVMGADVDRIARGYLEERELGSYFGHGLGHSLGLEIHEEPRLSKFGKEVLRENMLITDEPGVYIPGWGGIRIEDTVLITQDGGEPLTRASKEFVEICL